MTNFGDLDFKPAQQGELDSLCGVYAATNFISRRLGLAEDGEKRWRYSRRLLEHLAAREKFTVSRVCSDGFKNGQIQAAFNKISEEIGLGATARGLGSLLRKRKSGNLRDFMLTLSADEAVMLRVDEECHWILVHSARDDTFIVDDSYKTPISVRKKMLAKRFKNADLKNGIAFLNA